MTLFGPTCGMAADTHRSCGTTWLTDPAPILTLPTVIQAARLHRCGFMGDHHTGHQCPCGSMLVAAEVVKHGAVGSPRD